MSEPVMSAIGSHHWWGMLCPRAATNGSLLSRLVSVAVQLPALLIGLCVAVGLIVVLPLWVIAVVCTNLLFDGRTPARTTDTSG